MYIEMCQSQERICLVNQGSELGFNTTSYIITTFFFLIDNVFYEAEVLFFMTHFGGSFSHLYMVRVFSTIQYIHLYLKTYLYLNLHFLC